jgi:hypothetical protein
MILLTIVGLFIVAAVAGLSYYLGYQRNIDTVKLMEREQYIKDDQYGKGLGNLQKENADTATRNVVVCAEYQKLYQSYTELYALAPAPKAERYIIPGSARGEVDPCYGEVE